jgi:6-phosphogluconolactonase
MARITIVDAASLADTAAERLTQLVEQSIAAGHVANVALTGGSTPEATYAVLGDQARPYRERIDWSHVQLFWGDERHVPPDHQDSNFGMAKRALLQHVPIPPDHVHRVHAERPDPHDAAAEYAREVPAIFDVMLLGLGPDCHIASIFPGSDLLKTRPVDRVVAVFAPQFGTWRITMTPQVILESRRIVMLVGGQSKAAAVAAAIEGPLDVVKYPGQLLREADPRVEWIVDVEAASALRA